MEADRRAGQVAVITGGGRGFGKAFGAALASIGVHVVLVDLDGSEVERTAAIIREKGGSAVGLQGDVTDDARMTSVMQAASERSGHINILINNAGLHSDEYSRPLAVLGIAKIRRLFDVNVMGVVCCTLTALPHMEGVRNASIVNIASSAAHMGGSAYGNSKLAVAGLTITMAREFGRAGVRVNAISPGLILTDTIRSELSEATKARVKAMQFIDSDGEEQDVVEAMIYLTSAAARFVTGEVLRVGGGMAAGV